MQTDRQGQRETKRYVRFCCLGKKKRDIRGHAGIWTDEQIYRQTNRETDSINVGASRKTAVPVTTFLVSGNIVTGRVVFGGLVWDGVVSGSVFSGRVVSGSVFFGPHSLWQCFFRAG